jgi:hypothetical protein
MDIVRIFQQFCIDNDYYFSYGTRSVQNLLTNPDTFNEDKVHLLLEPVRRISNVSNGGLSVRTRTYSGKYMFVLRDNYDLNYFNEKGTDEAESKYTTRIEPLLPLYAALEKQFIACNDLDLVAHDNIDITDALDANLTGLVCTFQFRAYE